MRKNCFIYRQLLLRLQHSIIMAFIATLIVMLAVQSIQCFNFFGALTTATDPRMKPNEGPGSIPIVTTTEVAPVTPPEITGTIKIGPINDETENDSNGSTTEDESQIVMGDLKKMEESGIVPNYVAKMPAQVLNVKFGEDSILTGEEWTPTEVQNAPEVSWQSEEGCLYTLIDVDLDSDKNTQTNQTLHWLVVNIPGGNIQNGTTVVEYEGSNPREGSGLHRYVFLLYKQSKALDAQTYGYIRGADSNFRFNNPLSEILAKFQLEDPEAGNFYTAQWDVNVPISR